MHGVYFNMSMHNVYCVVSMSAATCTAADGSVHSADTVLEQSCDHIKHGRHVQTTQCSSTGRWSNSDNAPCRGTTNMLCTTYKMVPSELTKDIERIQRTGLIFLLFRKLDIVIRR